MPRNVEVAGKTYDFNRMPDLAYIGTPEFSKAIYINKAEYLWQESIKGSVLNEDNRNVERNLTAFQWSLYRVLKLQVALSKIFIGYEEQIRLLLACAIAQEPILFIGKPGVAKTELAVNFFSGIGLRKPKAAETPAGDANKYFEYLLSPFTIPEELFGPLNFEQLNRGEVARINTNMVTGKMVRGVFLDEIFNASSSILNTLLTLINERRYFDRGMFQEADLRVFISASNRTPAGKYGSGDGLRGGRSGELEAFYDRFTIRLYFPTPQELHTSQPQQVVEAYELIDRVSRERFMEKLTLERPRDFPQIASVNDILLLGRVLNMVDFKEEIDVLKNRVVAGLAMSRSGRDLCLMSPRKPNKLRPIIIADSFLLDLENIRREHVREGKVAEKFYNEFTTKKILDFAAKKPLVTKQNLNVFFHIWDYEGDRGRLKEEVKILLETG